MQFKNIYHQNLELYSFTLHLQKNKEKLADTLLQQAISGIERNVCSAKPNSF